MIAADAMSYRTILADLAAFYREQEPSPAVLDYQYRTYLHEHGTSMSAAAEKEGAWWRERVTDYPEAPSLPLVPSRRWRTRTGRCAWMCCSPRIRRRVCMTVPTPTG